MAVLKELKPVQQHAGESRRRWFGSPDMDLIVWYDDGGRPTAFELYYDKHISEHVFIWRDDTGYGHMAVDDGEQKPVIHHKETPILVPDGVLDVDRIKDLFAAASEHLPEKLVAFVNRKLTQHPECSAAG